jgi:hypothetical protein
VGGRVKIIQIIQVMRLITGLYSFLRGPSTGLYSFIGGRSCRAYESRWPEHGSLIRRHKFSSQIIVRREAPLIVICCQPNSIRSGCREAIHWWKGCLSQMRQCIDQPIQSMALAHTVGLRYVSGCRETPGVERVPFLITLTTNSVAQRGWQVLVLGGPCLAIHTSIALYL